MKQTHLKILALGGVVTIGILFLLFSQQVKGAVTSPDWPAFEMVYEDWGQARGINGSGGFVRVKLTYLDRTHWRSEILSDSTVPETNRSFSELSPDTLTSYDSRTRQSSSLRLAPGEPIYGADDWLRPGQVSGWIEKHHAVVTATAAQDINQMVFFEQIPCDSEISKCETPFYKVVTQIKYRTEQDIPMEMTITRDGQLRRHITVTDFKWLGTTGE